MTMTSTMMLNRAHDGSVNDEHDDSVDPAAKATRRRFTREFKRRIVDEYNAADRRGTRRGVAPGRSHTSHISKWRHQLARAEQPSAAFGGAGRVAPPAEKNAKLETELERTRFALEIEGKHTRSWRSSPRTRTSSTGSSTRPKWPPRYGTRASLTSLTTVSIPTAVRFWQWTIW
jgi:transposase